MSEIKKLRPITAGELAAKGVVALADRPNARGGYGQGGLSAADLKKWFDKLSGFLATKINDLQNVLASPEAADYIALEKAYDEVRTLGDLIRSLESGIFASTILHAQLPGFIDSNTVLQNVLNRIATEIGENNTDIAALQKPVTSERIADGAVTTAKIANSAVTEAKMDAAHIQKVQSAIKSVSYNNKNGVLTFTSVGGATQSVDLPLEEILTDVYFSEGTAGEDSDDAIVFVFANGATIRVPTSSMLKDLMEYAQGLREGYYVLQKAPPLRLFKQAILFPPPTLAQIAAEQGG
jgi:hypothetical protein